MEVKVTFLNAVPSEPSKPINWSRNARIFILGLAWTCAGGVGPAAMALWQDLTTYKDYGIGWKNIGWMALSGMGPLAIAYYRKHKALLTPPSLAEEMAEARALIADDAKQGKTTTVEKTETMTVISTPAPVVPSGPDPTQPPKP